MPNISIYSGKSDRICYLILPEGLTGESLQWIEENALETGFTTVVITGINWNDDLTPWEAEGVFKKGKPFGGKSEEFLKALTEEIIPETELKLGIRNPKRSLVGISLSGLFTLWAIHRCDAFSSAGIISGSFWYDNLVTWIKANKISTRIEKIYITLGDREKNTKNSRMNCVEVNTNEIVQHIENKGINLEYILFEGTHFSPILPRLKNTFEFLNK
ncbi:MAG: hypothetical protein MJZ16_06350 [Bacteroidales bacterium]|nr:hypothetical protein [Bacteroidales bacterium]